jgi:excisionase family DNA binding protein
MAGSSKPRVDAKAVAAALGVSLPTIYKLARTGQLPGTVWVGGTVRFDLDAIEAWASGGGTRSLFRRPEVIS